MQGMNRRTLNLCNKGGKGDKKVHKPMTRRKLRKHPPVPRRQGTNHSQEKEEDDLELIATADVSNDGHDDNNPTCIETSMEEEEVPDWLRQLKAFKAEEDQKYSELNERETKYKEEQFAKLYELLLKINEKMESSQKTKEEGKEEETFITSFFQATSW